MRSDHRVAGSSPAGCKLFYANVLRHKHRPVTGVRFGTRLDTPSTRLLFVKFYSVRRTTSDDDEHYVYAVVL